MGAVAGIGLALYAGHHVGDYWVQSDHQARNKGDVGTEGVLACLLHVAGYVATQLGFLVALALVTDFRPGPWALLAGLAVSGVTHYLADRREHGLMFWLARHIPGKAAFLELGKPRVHRVMAAENPDDPMIVTKLDNPTLGTGAWALDQAWHVFWGVFVTALVIAGLS